LQDDPHHSGVLRNQGQNEETDDRPWFQVMKRRRQASATVGSNHNTDSVFDYNDDYNINDSYNDNYSSNNYSNGIGRKEASPVPVAALQASCPPYEGYLCGYFSSLIPYWL
jgi:hypothetical protein